MAATGGTFVLGRGNVASTTTTLKNSGTAATLTLPQARAGQAPLAVSSWAGKATHLDSDELDGLDSTVFALAGAARVGSVEGGAEGVDLDGDAAPDAYVADAGCPSGSKVTGGGHEVFTVAGALVSRADSNGWVVVSVPGAGSTLDDVYAVAQCYNPRGGGQRSGRGVLTPGADRAGARPAARLLRAALRRSAGGEQALEDERATAERAAPVVLVAGHGRPSLVGAPAVLVAAEQGVWRTARDE